MSEFGGLIAAARMDGGYPGAVTIPPVPDRDAVERAVVPPPPAPEVVPPPPAPEVVPAVGVEPARAVSRVEITTPPPPPPTSAEPHGEASAEVSAERIVLPPPPVVPSPEPPSPEAFSPEPPSSEVLSPEALSPEAPSPEPPPPAPGEEVGDVGATIVVDRRPVVLWTLHVDGGPSIPLSGDRIVLGRKPAGSDPTAVEVAVPDPTRTVSKVHARLELDEGRWSITDLNATNGVIVIESDGSERLLAAGATAPILERFVLGRVGMRLSYDGGGARS